MVSGDGGLGLIGTEDDSCCCWSRLSGSGNDAALCWIWSPDTWLAFADSISGDPEFASSIVELSGTDGDATCWSSTPSLVRRLVLGLDTSPITDR